MRVAHGGRNSSAVEQRFCKPKVGGSIPSSGTILPQRRLSAIIRIMASATEKKALNKWLILALVLIALVAGYLAYNRISSDWNADQSAGEAERRAEVEKSLAEFKTYQAIKELYPEAYEELVRLILSDMGKGTDMKQAMIANAEFTTKLRHENAQYYAMASVERLRLSLNAQIPQYRYLKTAYGFKACNELATNGGVAVARTLGADFLKDQTLTQMMDEVTGYFFRTAAEGRGLKLRHEQPTAADWQVTFDYLKSKGMTDADIKLTGEPAKHPAEPQLCDAITKFYETITTMDNDAAKRILPNLAASAAAG
jgi:hypothetical protein